MSITGKITAKAVTAKPRTQRRSHGHTRNRVDAWMACEFLRIKRQKIALVSLGGWALFPVIFMAPAIVTSDDNTLNKAVADVLGSGGEALLLLTLLISPLRAVTRQRWFVPLRKWYGIMFAVTIITDGIVASITTGFAGGSAGRVAGHSFLLAGFTMVLLSIPLLAISNNLSMRWLGRYWKPIQKYGTFAIWGLVFVHLALLEGFGYQAGANGSGDCSPSGEVCDGDPVPHQRLYQFAACSLFLVVLRLPAVRRWIGAKQKAGQSWQVYGAVLPLAILFVVGFAMIVNEEIFKGAGAFTLHPSDA
jgi:DMSO/TMAO reductase YedYZ heme-binding membrane subunit